MLKNTNFRHLYVRSMLFTVYWYSIYNCSILYSWIELNFSILSLLFFFHLYFSSLPFFLFLSLFLSSSFSRSIFSEYFAFFFLFNLFFIVVPVRLLRNIFYYNLNPMLVKYKKFPTCCCHSY